MVVEKGGALELSTTKYLFRVNMENSNVLDLFSGVGSFGLGAIHALQFLDFR